MPPYKKTLHREQALEYAKKKKDFVRSVIVVCLISNLNSLMIGDEFKGVFFLNIWSINKVPGYMWQFIGSIVKKFTHVYR